MDIAQLTPPGPTPLPALDNEFIDFVATLRRERAVLTDTDAAVQRWEDAKCAKGVVLLERHRKERECLNAQKDKLHLKLPPETIGEIFEQVVGDIDLCGTAFWKQDAITYQDMRVPWVLAQVSRTWRRSVLSNPRLWGRIIIREYHSDLIATMLEFVSLSKASPLHILIQFKTSPIPPNVMQVLTDNLYRIYTLQLNVSVGNLQQFSFPLRLPAMSSLVIHTTNFLGHSHPVIDIEAAPTRLRAHYIDPKRTGVNFSLLSYVDLIDVDLPVLHTLLATATRLRTCKVYVSTLSPPVEQELSHPFVEELSFNSPYYPEALDFLDFPNLKYLAINPSSDGTQSLVRMLRHSNCRLLGFAFDQGDPDILVPFFCMPSITHVEIFGMYASSVRECLGALMTLSSRFKDFFSRIQTVTLFVEEDFLSDVSNGNDEACLFQALIILLGDCMPNPISVHIVTPQSAQCVLVNCKQGALEVKGVLEMGHKISLNGHPIGNFVNFEAQMCRYEIIQPRWRDSNASWAPNMLEVRAAVESPDWVDRS